MTVIAQSVEKSPVNPYAVVAVVALGLFLTLLDLTIVNIGIPQIVTDLNASLDDVLWMLNAYSLVYAVLLITSGRLGDIFGPRAMFLLGVAVFTVASAASGLAQTPLQLILARAAQGLGAAILAPQALPINLRMFPPERRAIVFAVYGAIAGLAIVIGPTLGGFLVTNFGWRWIFYVNLPVGIALLALTVLIVPDFKTNTRHRLDISGVALATAGLLAIVFGLIEGERHDWGTVVSFITIPMIIAAGVALLITFFFVQRSRQDREPLLPFGVFAERNFTLMALVLGAMGFAILGLFLPLTIYFQSVLHLSAVDAGLTIAPQALAMFFTSPFVAMTISRFGGKWILFAGLVLFTGGVAFIAANVSSTGGRWDLLPGLIVSGIGMAGVWTPLYDLATRDLQPRFAGVASGILNTIQEVGTVLASAAAGALLQARLAADLVTQARIRSEELPPPFREGFIDGFARAADAGLQVGASQSASQLPAGLPPQAVEQIMRVSQAVFGQGFVDAMRVTLLLPIAIVLLATLAVLAARNPGRAQAVDAEAIGVRGEAGQPA